MKDIDCLFIGHNEMDFAEYEQNIRKMGMHSGAYRDLSLNFFHYNNRPYSVTEIYNVLYASEAGPGDFSPASRPLHVGENFSAAIAYLATYLHRRNFTFDFVNSFQDKKEELKQLLTGNRILAAAIPTTLYVSAFPIIEIIDFVRTHNPAVKIIVGGPFVSTQVRSQDPAALEYLFKTTIGADVYVNSSQGEAALVKVLHALKQRQPLDTIANIRFKTESGDYAAAPLSREDNPLAENMVDWNLFYDRAGEYVNVRTAISCPFHCAFCGFPERAGAYQTVDVALVEKELTALAKIKSVKSVHFIDDTFNVPPKRFKELCRMMIGNRFDFKWHSYFRCQYADEEMVELMKESGCEGVFLGIESGSDRILKNMNKEADAAKYLEGIRLLKKHGIVTFGNFIIGFPGETHETVQETVQFIESGGLDFYRVQLWYSEPITPIWKEKEKYDLQGESFEWSHKTMNNREACDIVDEVFATRRSAVWVPQYNFDFDTFWHLVHRGMPVSQGRGFLQAFNDAVREKLTSAPAGALQQKEASFRAVERIKEACLGTREDSDDRENKNEQLPDLSVDFDF